MELGRRAWARLSLSHANASRGLRCVEVMDDVDVLNTVTSRKFAAEAFVNEAAKFLAEAARQPEIPSCTAGQPWSPDYKSSWRHPDARFFVIRGDEVSLCPHCQPKLFRQAYVRAFGCPPAFRQD